MFVGRNEELKTLTKVYIKDGFQLFILYGNKRVGKTVLLEEFCKDKDTIFFQTQPISSRANLKDFSTEILSHYNDKKTVPFNFWESAFNYIKEKQNGSKIIVIIDEFAEIAERDPAFMSVICNTVIKELKDSNIFLILSSNNVKFVQELFVNNINKISGKIYLENFLNDSTVEQLKQEAIRRSQGINGAKFLRFSADEILVQEGKINNAMYKIISGNAISYLNYGKDNEYLLGRLKENAQFGEYSVLTGKPAISTIVAFSDVLAMKIDKNEFIDFINSGAISAIDIIKAQANMLGNLQFHINMLIEELEDKNKKLEIQN